MDTADSIFIGGADGAANPQFLKLRYANRHGLITGATGTGKTVSLQILAEGFSRAGVPVFMADVKGDLSGLCVAGAPHEKLSERARVIGLEDYSLGSMPTVFWDLFGEKGHPIRTTISEMGPLLLSRVLDLNETQEGVLHVAFELADEEGLLILDLNDLRSLMQFVGENANAVSTAYGRVSTASVGAIQRKLLQLEQQGGDMFFGEPALNLNDFMTVAPDGRGRINVLSADKLMMTPRLYATFQLWLLSELFEELPEVGDPEKPRLVFFFDEAHLLFDNMPKAVIERIEMVVRLIRSKGVGVYFVTQNPLDVPDDVLGQLGNRIQHALRAFTPRDQKAVRAAAETFRPNPAFDAEEVIGQLGVGEALVSTLENKGVPTMVQRTLIRPPTSRLGPARDDERRQAIATSPVAGRYDTPIDRHSAHEELTQRAEQAARDAEIEAMREEEEKAEDKRRALEERRLARQMAKQSGRRSTSDGPWGSSAPKRKRSSRSSSRQSVGEAFAKSVARSMGSKLGRDLVRGVLGSLFKGR